MRRALFAIIFFSIAAISNEASAQSNGVGAGLIIGAPTGISAKFWTTGVNAIDVAIGWSNDGEWARFDNGYYYYYGPSFLHIHADYLWHDFNAIRSQERFPIYYGFGFHFDEGYSAPSAFGIRGVVGIDWMPRTVPLDVFLEFAPVVFLAPGSGIGLDAGIGTRFFFH